MMKGDHRPTRLLQDINCVPGTPIINTVLQHSYYVPHNLTIYIKTRMLAFIHHYNNYYHHYILTLDIFSVVLRKKGGRMLVVR